MLDQFSLDRYFKPQASTSASAASETGYDSSEKTVDGDVDGSGILGPFYPEAPFIFEEAAKTQVPRVRAEARASPSELTGESIQTKNEAVDDSSEAEPGAAEKESEGSKEEEEDEDDEMSGRYEIIWSETLACIEQLQTTNTVGGKKAFTLDQVRQAMVKLPSQPTQSEIESLLSDFPESVVHGPKIW